MKLPFFSQRDSSETRLGIDVGTTAVKILDPERVSYSSAYLDKYSVFDTDAYTEALVKRGVEKALNRMNLEDVDRVLLTLPPNCFRARTTSLVVEREQQGDISRKEKKKLLEKAREKIKEEISSELGILPEDLYFRSWDLIKIKIDGYSVPKLEGYNGKEVQMKFLVTFVLSKFLSLREVVEEQLEANVELVHLSQGILNNINQLRDGIYLDIGGELTQAFLVEEQELQFTGSAKVGGRTFSQILEENLGLSELRSRVLKERYAREELSMGATQSIKEILREGKGYWIKEIKELLQKQETKSLPSTFYLFGGGSKLSEVQIVLKQEQWENFAFLKSPQVRFLTPRSSGFNFLDIQYTSLTLIINNYGW